MAWYLERKGEWPVPEDVLLQQMRELYHKALEARRTLVGNAKPRHDFFAAILVRGNTLTIRVGVSNKTPQEEGMNTPWKVQRL